MRDVAKGCADRKRVALYLAVDGELEHVADAESVFEAEGIVDSFNMEESSQPTGAKLLIGVH